MIFFTGVMQTGHNEGGRVPGSSLGRVPVRGPGRSLRRVLAAVLLTAAVSGAAACSSGAAPAGAANRTITVSAASSLKDALSQLGKDFESRHAGVEVDFNFGASGDLEQQIIGGAPVDVFAAASTKEMDDLGGRGLIMEGTMIEPAGNSVVLVAPAASDIRISSFGDLAGSGVMKIAIGNPGTVPAGRYARETLADFRLWDALQGKLVFGDSVRQVLDYVARGEVDAGIVYATDARLRSGEVRTVAVAPDASHQPVVYPMAIVTGTKDESLARQFLDYAASPEARPVFDRYGFEAAP